MGKRSKRELRLERKPRGPRKKISVEPRTDGQKSYIEAIASSDIVICEGFAGTGKTLLAVGMALKLLQENPDVYKKIIMVRPAIAVKGEDMGYLPGDADAKMRPFVAPMFDSLDFFVDKGAQATLFETGCIDVIPIAYMRGRTFNNSIIIFDEAQNSRWEHMKMFLTRIGFNTKAIVEGDGSQSDLEGRWKEKNGLSVAVDKLAGIDGVSIVRLEDKDVVRSPIVRRLLKYI